MAKMKIEELYKESILKWEKILEELHDGTIISEECLYCEIFSCCAFCDDIIEVDKNGSVTELECSKCRINKEICDNNANAGFIKEFGILREGWDTDPNEYTLLDSQMKEYMEGKIKEMLKLLKENLDKLNVKN